MPQLRRLVVPALLIVSSLSLGYALGVSQSLDAQPDLRQVDEDQLPLSVVGPPGRPAHTVYMYRRAEKEKAAKAMTELHAYMASKGYTFSDLEPYLENSDLEGWWITYVALDSP